MTERQKCDCCGEWLGFMWSDTHGVGVCINCGLPYRLFHYAEDGTLEDKPPVCAIKAEWLPAARAYWEETKSRVFPGSFDLGIPRSGRSYSGATAQDATKFNEWMHKHPEHHPVKAA